MNTSINVLFAASEATPLVRTSFMGDVTSALPLALLNSGVNASLIIPRYTLIPEFFHQKCLAEKIPVPIGSHYKHVNLYQTNIENLTVYLIDQPDYYHRDSLYRNESGDYPDNAERFIFFDRAVVEVLPLITPAPSIIHCHDWQTGLIPLYLKRFKNSHATFRKVKSLFTIHNLAYQGLFWRFDMHLTGLPWEYFTSEGIEFYGDINLLKAGLLYSDAVSTVSPSYCREIQTTEFGCGLEGVLQSMSHKLYGILNGADYSRWTSVSNSSLAAGYGIDNLEGKRTCKIDLLQKTGLDPDPAAPLVAMISPLYSRKGLDLLEIGLPEFMRMGIRVILQGTGDRNYVNVFSAYANQNPSQFCFIHNFDQNLSQKIMAGSDILLKPSRFEPCGLNQLYALRFGTIPIIHQTGGLDDTVFDHDPEFPAAQTGFKFHEYTPDALISSVQRALKDFRDPLKWECLIRAAMSQDFSWKKSAEHYIELYNKILIQDVKDDPVV